jgi:hypothetical protein
MPKFIADDAVALTGGIFQLCTVGDGYMAPRIFDEACLLKLTRSYRHGCAGRTQHVAEKFMGERYPVGLQSVVGGQQPSANRGAMS